VARLVVEVSGDQGFAENATARGDSVFPQFVAAALDDLPLAARAIGVLMFAVDHVAGVNVSQAGAVGDVGRHDQ
jgi:hypothetical protein